MPVVERIISFEFCIVVGIKIRREPERKNCFRQTSFSASYIARDQIRTKPTDSVPFRFLHAEPTTTSLLILSIMALHRHQSSLEKVLDFSQPFSLTPQQRQAATTLFRYLIQHYGLERTIQSGYKPAALIQATFEHVTSKDAFLLFFFSHIYENLCSGVANPIDSDITVVLSFFDGFSSWDQNQKQNANGAIESFAEYIVENFLLPRMPSVYTSPPPESYVNTNNLVRASSVKTPQPTPRSLSSIQASTPTGTTQRVSILRQSCLVRDHHRCVVSRKFDKSEAGKRWKQDGEDCKDDDGNLLKNESSDRFQYLEVAHILPHCLTTVSSRDNDLVCLQ